MKKRSADHENVDYVKGFWRSLWSLIKLKKFDVEKERNKRKKGIVDFDVFGLRVYSGRQGSGKTMGLVEAMAQARDKYPMLTIVSNFECKYADVRLRSLNDLLHIKNGSNGVLFCIDELQNEFSSNVSKDFPSDLLSLITQQRKQRIAIFCTSQVFTRLAKPLREQSYEVCTCRTWLKRLTRIKCYDADEFMAYVADGNVNKRYKASPKWSHWFVQTEGLRNAYDTYSIVSRLARTGVTFKQWADSTAQEPSSR